MATLTIALVILVYGLMAVAGLIFDKDKNREEFERDYRQFILQRTFDAANWKTMEETSHEKTTDQIPAA